jgi:hypothetical protein
MAIEDDISCCVESIRGELRSIRNSGVEDAIECELDSIESECDTLVNLEADDPDDQIDEAFRDMGLGSLYSHWNSIDVGTATKLKEAVARILKEHGYPVG